MNLIFNIDIVYFYYARELNYDNYAIFFGFGEPIEKSFYYRKNKILIIYYGTEMHVCYQNNATLKRIEEVYKKKNKWLFQSGRIVEKAWPIQKTLADSIICIGNDYTVNSYRKYFDGTIYNIPVSYYKIFNHEEILNN